MTNENNPQKAILSLKGKADLHSNSKQIEEGDIFIAQKGASFDGHCFIEGTLLNKGAIGAVYTTKIKEEDENLLRQKYLAKYNKEPILCQINHGIKELAKILQSFYDIPSKIVAITGTNGKTSTAYFATQICSLAKGSSAFIGTTGVICFNNGIENKIQEPTLTTLDIVSCYRILHKLHKLGVESVFLEASSMGICQDRLEGIPFSVTSFTNITDEHLNYHKTREEYFKQKLRLFTELSTDDTEIALNIQDTKTLEIIKNIKNKKISLFGSTNFKQDKIKVITETAKQFGHKTKLYLAEPQEANLEGLEFKIDNINFKANILGDYQIENLTLAIICVSLLHTDISLADISKTFKHIKSPAGRMEKVAGKRGIFFVDYAHTPDGFEKLFSSLVNIKSSMLTKYKKSRIVCLLGCGGERDQDRRPEKGKIASKYSDILVITDENSRNENPKNIRTDIIKGTVGNHAKVVEIAGRENAVDHIIKNIEDGDIVVLAGKGHETTQIISGKTTHYNDKECLESKLKLYGLQDDKSESS